MSDDLRVFRELILWLWQAHEKPWDYKNEDAQLIVEAAHLLDSTFGSDADLEANLPSENNVNTDFGNQHFYLTPVVESRIMVPRIQLKCDFGRNIPEIRCRLELFLLSDDAEVKSLGYRFESPEGQNIQGVGIHHYYHVQLIRPSKSNANWLPETQPAFPIDADDPVKLMLCLLMSLYGLEYLGVLLREAHNVWELRQYINGVPHMRPGPFEWYRHVGIGHPPKYTDGYRITSKPDEFDAYIQGIYPGCKIRGITSSAFRALKSKSRKIYP